MGGYPTPAYETLEIIGQLEGAYFRFFLLISGDPSLLAASCVQAVHSVSFVYHWSSMAQLSEVVPRASADSLRTPSPQKCDVFLVSRRFKRNVKAASSMEARRHYTCNPLPET